MATRSAVPTFGEAALLRAQSPLPGSYHEIEIVGDDLGFDHDSFRIKEALDLREKYKQISGAGGEGDRDNGRAGGASVQRPKGPQKSRKLLGTLVADSKPLSISRSTSSDSFVPGHAGAGPLVQDSTKDVLNMIGRSMSPRVSKELPPPPPSGVSVVEFQMVDGVMQYTGQPASCQPMPYRSYYADVRTVYLTVEDPACKRNCANRLEILEKKMEMHRVLNQDLESKGGKFEVGQPDIFESMKVDNSVRLATAMNCQSLLEFMISTCNSHGDDVVKMEGGKPVTLLQMLHRYGIMTADSLTVEGLGLQPGPKKQFHRFDIFSTKYSRGGEGSVELLLLFLKF
eukprot:RCo048916